MKLVVGLGNPGPSYSRTRHNIGFRIAEELAARHSISIHGTKFDGEFGRGRIGGVDVGILRPQTYMNLSGKSVAQALRLLPVEEISEDLIVAFDDVDLPFGQIRIKPSGGAGGQKGVASIIASIGRKDFPRLRFGIGRSERMATSDYVLQRFSGQEEADLPACIGGAVSALEEIIQGDLSGVMTRYNTRGVGQSG